MRRGSQCLPLSSPRYARERRPCGADTKVWIARSMLIAFFVHWFPYHFSDDNFEVQLCSREEWHAMNELEAS